MATDSMINTDDGDIRTIKTDAGGAPKASKKQSKKKKEVPEPIPSESESDAASEAEASSNSSDDDSSESGSGVSFSTTDILSNDPLYFVLSKIFITKDDVNIATLLEQIVQRLDKLCDQKTSSKKH
jgi:hypothetical protein